MSTRLRDDLVAAGLVTETGRPDREAFADALAEHGAMSRKTARRYSYRWTALNGQAKRLSSKNAELAARILGTDPSRYLYLPPDSESALADVRASLRDAQERLQQVEARLRALEDS